MLEWEDLEDDEKEEFLKDTGYSESDAKDIIFYEKSEMMGYLYDLQKDAYGSEIENLLFYVDFDAMLMGAIISGDITTYKFRGTEYYYFIV